MVRRGDQLLEHINAGGNDSSAQELLQEFFTGYPVENLRLLLQSEEVRAVKTGAWIASELGNSITPLVKDVSQLLDHPSRFVRFFACDAVLVGATKAHGEAIAKAVLLIQDVDKAVRWKALCFLARATKDQLVAGTQYLSDKSVTTLMDWMLGLGSTDIDKQEIVMRLENKAILTRLFAAAAAARFSQYDLAPLEQSAISSDAEVSSFAKEELEKYSS